MILIRARIDYGKAKKAFYQRERERRAYLAANPTLSDAPARWTRYEDMILAKYGGVDLNEAWLRRDGGSTDRASEPEQLSAL
jgi:hypothetical protein